MNKDHFKAEFLRLTDFSEEAISEGMAAIDAENVAKKRHQAVADFASRIQQELDDNGADEAIALLQGGLKGVEEIASVELPKPCLIEEFYAALESTPEGFETGFKIGDSTVTLPVGLTLLIGGMVQGKTTFMLSMLRDVVERYPDRRHYFLSYEERSELTALKIIAGWSGQRDLKLIKKAVLEYCKGKGGGILKDHPILKSAIDKFQTLTDTEALIIARQYQRIDWTCGGARMGLARMIMELGKNRDTGVVFIDEIEEAAMLQEVAQDKGMTIVATTKNRTLAEDAALALGLELIGYAEMNCTVIKENTQ
tara:strand:+ start:268 stop:1197 length:930 start_codon:yes stop_codon:yes gene_type:complete